MFMSKVKLHGDTIVELSKAIGITTPRLSAKINGWQGAQFTQNEISAIKQRYDLQAWELEQIFFNEKVSYKDTNGEVSEVDD
jgi:hypothetical protein